MRGCSSALLATDSHHECLPGVCPLPGEGSQAWSEPRNQDHTWVGPHPYTYVCNRGRFLKAESLLVMFGKRLWEGEGWRHEVTWAAPPGPPAASGRSAAALQLPGRMRIMTRPRVSLGLHRALGTEGDREGSGWQGSVPQTPGLEAGPRQSCHQRPEKAAREREDPGTSRNPKPPIFPHSKQAFGARPAAQLPPPPAHQAAATPPASSLPGPSHLQAAR